MSDISANSVDASIKAKLIARFAPLELELTDESARHKGHLGARRAAAARSGAGAESGAAAESGAGGAARGEEESGATHFRLRMVSACFSGMGALARHRAVYAALADELQNGVHALALELKAPNE